jgi:hypothetical protein
MARQSPVQKIKPALTIYFLRNGGQIVAKVLGKEGLTDEEVREQAKLNLAAYPLGIPEVRLRFHINHATIERAHAQT